MEIKQLDTLIKKPQFKEDLHCTSEPTLKLQLGALCTLIYHVLRCLASFVSLFFSLLQNGGIWNSFFDF